MLGEKADLGTGTSGGVRIAERNKRIRFATSSCTDSWVIRWGSLTEMFSGIGGNLRMKGIADAMGGRVKGGRSNGCMACRILGAGGFDACDFSGTGEGR